MSGKRSGFKRLLCLVLVCIFVSQLVPMSVLADVITETHALAVESTESTDEPVPMVSANATIPEEAEVTVESELVEQREANIKHYRMSDGSYAAVQYESAVHYLTENGTWAEIDNSLTHEISGGREVYSAQNGRLSKSFAADAESGELFSVSVDGYSVSMSLQREADAEIPEQPGGVETMSIEPETGIEAEIENPTTESSLGLKLSDIGAPSKNHSGLSYEDILDGTDIVYENTGYNIKESIVVKEAQVKYDYAFVLKTVGLTASVDEGAVTLKNNEGTEVFRIPAPYMIDAAGCVSDAASYSLTALNDGWVLTLTADKTWLNSSDRSFPVTIDPTLTVEEYMNNSSEEKLYATYVTSGRPNEAHNGYSAIFVGNEAASGSAECRVYFGVSELPTLPKNSVMTNAVLKLKQNAFSAGNVSSVTVGAYEVKRSTQISASFGSWLRNLKWNTKPETESELLDYKVCTSSTGSFTLDLTRTVAEWYAGAVAVKAIELRPVDMSSTQYAWTSLYGWSTGSSGPVLIISYRNTVGLEGYYSYQTVSAEKAGTVYIGDYSNQLTLVNTVAEYESGAVSASVSLVYNTANAGADSYGIGEGWKLSVTQSVRSESIGGSEYLVYNDADGTDHYFPKTATNTYKDEDGLGLTIVKSSSGYTMTDTDAYNTLTFASDGTLTKLTDSNGNVTNINYANGKPSSVTVKPNGGSTVTAATILYGSDGKLTGIKDVRGNTTSVSYDGEKLTGLTYVDGTSVSYGYDSGGYITSAEDKEREYGLSFTYWQNGFGGKTVNTVREYAGASKTAGGGFHAYKESQQLTGYRFYGTDHEAYTADDVVVYYVFDHSGRTICAYEQNYDKTEVLSATTASYTENSGTSAKNNRLTAAGSIGSSQTALYIDGGFEGSAALSGSGYEKISASSSTDSRVRTGGKSVKLTASGGTAYVTTQTTLSAGEEYTVSVWISNHSAGSWGESSYFVPVLKDGSGNITELGSRRNDKSTAGMENGWERFSWTFTATASGSYGIGIRAGNFSGSIYIDDMQLEKGGTASGTNLVQNSKPTSTACWVEDHIAYDANEASPFGSGVLRLNGTPGVNSITAQRIEINDNSGNCYVLSGWGKASAVGRTTDTYGAEDGSYFGMLAAVVYSDTDGEEWHMVPFDKDYDGWQYASGVVIPERDATVSFIRVYLIYRNNGNTAYFDNIRLESAPCSSYTYDDSGNAVAATEGGANMSCEYKDGTSLLTKYTASTGVVSTFTYEEATNRVLTSSSSGVSTQYSYNAMGEVTKSESVGGDGQKHVERKEYDNYGNLTKYTDTNGTSTEYGYNYSDYTVSWIKTSDLSAQQYRYNTNGRLSRTYIDGQEQLYYIYGSGRVTDIVRTGVETGGHVWQSYHFEYDEFGNLTKLGVSGANNTTAGSTENYPTLATYSYINHDLLQSISYGNGQSISYGYDEYGRKVSETYNGSSYSYEYGSKGELVSQSAEDESYAYEYDSLGRLIRSKEYDGDGDLVQDTAHVYDGANRLIRQTWRSDGGEFTQSYGYDAAKGNISSLKVYLPGNAYSESATPNVSVSYGYYSLNTPQRATTSVNGTELFYSGYWYPTVGDSVSTLPQFFNYRDSAGALLNGYTYLYDGRGNIASETDNAQGNAQKQYTYDDRNRLISVKDGSGNVLHSYTYDSVGNILSKTDGSVTHSYTYGNTQWQDLLTAFDGHTITYDGAGNPLTYYNGESSTLTWSRGRQLAGVTKGATTASYAYDMAGVRSSKTVSGVTYEFTTLSGKLMRQTWSGNEIQIVYDAYSRPYLLLYTPANGATQTYYYVLNVQSDVVGLMDGNLNVVVRYSYDPYGKPTGTTASSAYTALAAANPLRYRSYYYDAETGFYYLQSRYYDPAICRFINADSYLTTDITGMLSYNMFAYCEDNPVMYSDPTGEWVHILFGAFAGAVVGAAVAWASGEDTEGIVTAALSGAASGALTASGAGLTAQVAGTALISIGEHYYEQRTSEDGFNTEEFAKDVLIDTTFAIVGGKNPITSNAKSVMVQGKQAVKRVLNGDSVIKVAKNYYKNAHIKGGEFVFITIRNEIVSDGFRDYVVGQLK